MLAFSEIAFSKVTATTLILAHAYTAYKSVHTATNRASLQLACTDHVHMQCMHA